mmetsp:Transcript_6584/g.17678  ORF Transcript_6584/g.17678 Transcript_6584/m.17678 type:complete len:351 (-) Transcript_6584:953-2005(-)
MSLLALAYVAPGGHAKVGTHLRAQRSVVCSLDEKHRNVARGHGATVIAQISSSSAENTDPGAFSRDEASAEQSDRDAVVILPGLGNNTADYRELAAALRKRGHPTFLVSVARYDWARNAAGLAQPAYWRSQLKPRPILDWYFSRIALAVEAAVTACPGRRVRLVGHSAGGWLARVYLAECVADEARKEQFAALVTLGTPHRAPPTGSLDQSRGLLTYIESKYPGAYHRDDLEYTCVVGESVKGSLWSPQRDADAPVSQVTALAAGQTVAKTSDRSQAGSSRIEELLAYASYLPLCGRGEEVGDGITPSSIAFLDGARRVVIPEAKHSMLTAPADWYGAQKHLDTWTLYLQ